MPSRPARRQFLSERVLLASLRHQAEVERRRPGAVRVGIGDDCAVLRVPRGHEITVTTDLLLETTHFRRDWHSPEAVGYRCLARGLSDLASMGSVPLAAFLSFAVPPKLNGTWVQRFLKGLLGHAKQIGVPLSGGDTAQAPGAGDHALFTADITLIGGCPAGQALLRSGGQPGDLLYVTGRLGGSAAELTAITSRPARFRRLLPPDHLEKLAKHPHLFPASRLTQGVRLRSLATAAMDLSDGLSTDLTHLCDASGVRAILNAEAIPVHPLAGRAISLALHGGEDYELLFAARPSTAVPRSIGGVPITCIGQLAPRARGLPSISLVHTGPDATHRLEPVEPHGWQHFESIPAQPSKPAKRP